jgi:DNA-binding beta-propeller fold protein YncE
MPGRAAVLRTAAAALSAALLAASAGRVWGTGESSCRAYVVNQGSGDVSVVDLETMTVLGPAIELDGTLTGGAANPSGDRFWVSAQNIQTQGQGDLLGVAGSSPSRVFVLDASLDAVLADPDVGPAPRGIGPRPDGTGAYVACGEERETWLVASPANTASQVFQEGTSSFLAVDAAVSPDGTKVALVDRDVDRVRILSTTDHSAVGSAFTVNENPLAAAWSEDGAKLVVVGGGGVDILDAATGAALGTFPVSFYTYTDVVVRGAFAFATQEHEDDGGQGPAQVRVINLATDTLSLAIPLPGNLPTSILVSPDGTTAWVSMADEDLVREVSLVNQNLTGRTVATGDGPVAMGFVAAAGGGTETPIPAWFLPKKVKVSHRGEGRDSLVASGFFDDGGATVDWTDPVTLAVGGFEETFTMAPDPRGTSYRFMGTRVHMKVKPNLNGSSKGTFMMKIGKTTLSDLVPLAGEVDLSFTGGGLEECTGRVRLAAGKYALGKVKGALLEPGFFPSKATAKNAAGKPHTLSFQGGFATEGTAPSSPVDVSFSFGGTLSRTIPASAFSGSGGVFTHRSRESGTSLFLKVDHLREKVTVKTRGVDLGTLSGPTLDVVFDAGAGLGGFRNPIRLGTKGTARTY